MRTMKDSGIEWVGRVPQSWSVNPIRAEFQEVTEKNKLGLVKNALKFTYGNIVKKDNFISIAYIISYKIRPSGYNLKLYGCKSRDNYA